VSSLAERSAIVTGATSLVGRRLVPLLLLQGFEVQATGREMQAPGRGPADEVTGVRHVVLDLTRTPPAPGTLAPAAILVHTAPLWLLPGWLGWFAAVGVRRLVAFGSTSRQTKAASPSAVERETARRLLESEQRIEREARAAGVRFTLFRPTLVHGGGRDRNVSDIARFVRRFGFFPVAGRGGGRRQPVHAADLAAAVLAALDSPATFDRAYDLPGAETLSYCEMVERVALGLGRKPRIVHVPLPLLRGALSLARHLPGLAHLTPAMADRMEEDLVFDPEPARRAFGYAPQPFRFPDERWRSGD
jgi:nucleoside-diphosphate-sugar epimerase